MQEDVIVLSEKKRGWGGLPSKLPKPYFQTSSQFWTLSLRKPPLLPNVSLLISTLYSYRCRLHPALGLLEPCSLPAYLLHNTDDAGDEGVRVLVLLGTGVQVHASFLKYHLGTGPLRGGAQAWEDTQGGGALKRANGSRLGGGAIHQGAGPGYIYLGDGARSEACIDPGFSGTPEDGEGRKGECIPNWARPRGRG